MTVAEISGSGSIDEIVESIGNLTVGELLQFTEELKDKFGIEDFTAAPAPAFLRETFFPEDDDKVYSVVLVNSGPNRIEVIKIVKDIKSLGLKEAKDFIDTVPNVVASDLSSKAEADAIAEKLRAAGAVVEIK